jgi:transposase-like protein
MPKPIPDDVRAAILEDIRAGEMGCRAIARDHDVDPATVSKIAKDAGIADAFQRGQTENATIARQADNAALRASTSRRFLDEANKLLDDLHQPCTVFNFGGKDNTYEEHELPEPPSAEKRNLIVAAATAFDKHLAADRHDGNTGGDVTAARSLLGDLGRALGIAAEQLGREYETPVGD